MTLEDDEIITEAVEKIKKMKVRMVYGGDILDDVDIKVIKLYEVVLHVKKGMTGMESRRVLSSLKRRIYDLLTEVGEDVEVRFIRG